MPSPRLFIAAAAGLLAAHAATLAIWGDRGRGPLLSSLVQLGVGVLAMATAAGAARGRGVFERRFLRLIAARYVIWAVAQSLATYYVVADIGLDGSPADFLFHLQSVPLGVALFLHPGQTADRSDRAHPLELVQMVLFMAAISLDMHYLLTGSGLGLVASDAFIAGCFYFRAMTSRSTVAGAMFGRWTPAILLSTVNDAFATYYEALPGGAFDLIWSVEMIVWLLTAASWDPARAEVRGLAPIDRTVALLPLVVGGATLVVAFGVAQAQPVPGLGVVGAALLCAAAGVLLRRRAGAA